MKTGSLFCAAAALAVFAALPALAADAPPMPAPGPELAQLAFFAGDWTCTGKAEASPMGPEHATTAAVHIRRELGGFWYVGHLDEKKTAANPHPISFAFFMGYDGTAKMMTLDGYDVMGGRSHQTASGWQDGKLVFLGENAGGGPPIPARDTFTKKGDATLEHLGEMQVAGKWMNLDEETCTRTKTKK